jgi:hypothetical protein
MTATTPNAAAPVVEENDSSDPNVGIIVAEIFDDDGNYLAWVPLRGRKGENEDD